MPDKYESGTPNAIGLAGLGAGIGFLRTVGIDAIREKETALTKAFLEGAGTLKGIHLYGPPDMRKRTSVVSFNIEGMSPSEAAMHLDENYRILCRPGLHCAPLAHRTVGTFPQGTLRFSFGYYNTLGQIQKALKALEKISREH
jgi:selenocysteine lyase/cysteine desulfurase